MEAVAWDRMLLTSLMEAASAARRRVPTAAVALTTAVGEVFQLPQQASMAAASADSAGAAAVRLAGGTGGGPGAAGAGPCLISMAPSLSPTAPSPATQPSAAPLLSSVQLRRGMAAAAPVLAARSSISTAP